MHQATLLCGGEIRLCVTNHAPDLMNIGVASIAQVKSGLYTYKITEPLATLAIADAVKDLGLLPSSGALATMDNFLQLAGPRAQGKGSFFELLVAACLVEADSTTVADFARAFLSPDQYPVLPKWTKSATLDIGAVASATQLGFKDDIEACRAFLQGKLSSTALLPSTAMRPDLFRLFRMSDTEDTKQASWAFSASCKVLANKLDDSKGEDIRSTQLDKLYWQRDGQAVNATVLRRKLDTLLAEYPAVGSLRLHVVLPGAPALSAVWKVTTLSCTSTLPTRFSF